MPNLALTRRTNESIWIGDDVKITVVSCSQGRVRLLIEAPKEIVILRDELRERSDNNEEGSR